jgi:hypothetical protein
MRQAHTLNELAPLFSTCKMWVMPQAANTVASVWCSFDPRYSWGLICGGNAGHISSSQDSESSVCRNVSIFNK